MVQACNPSNLGGRDREDHGSRPVGRGAVHKTLSQPIVGLGRFVHLSSQLHRKYK
jgi:hypothetical protein